MSKPKASSAQKPVKGYAIIDPSGKVTCVSLMKGIAWATAEEWTTETKFFLERCGYRCIRVQIPMSNDKETNGKLLTDADVERMKGDVQKWMREPEQWRQLLTHRFNSLLADRHARIEQNRKGIETMFEKMCELDTPKRGELHLLLISLFS